LLCETNGGFLISQIKQVSGRIFERLLARAGVDAFNGPQGRILYVLWQADGIPIAVLAKKTGLAKTTPTSMLDRMEAAGLLSRAYDKADRRQIRISLTAQARALRGEYDAVSRSMSELFYAGFTDPEILAFENTLRRILQNLELHEQSSKIGGNPNENQ
jgi:DNA-binding MarR family transcriptional regulator